MTSDDRSKSRSADKARADAQRAPPPSRATPPPATQRPRVEPTNTERGGSIAPQLVDAGDGSIGVAWRPIQLGPAQSYGCTVTGASNGALAVTIEQGAYQKTSSGTGSVDIAAIPVAAIGTSGRLVASDRATGASVRFEWQWRSDTGAAPAGLFRKQTPARPADLVRGAPASRAAARSEQHAAAKPGDRTRERDGQATTMFFGQPARGRRFAFILDVSGSMEGVRWGACRRECEGALTALIGAGDYCVVLFSYKIELQPGRDGWIAADSGAVNETLAWLGGVRPAGGTYPKAAFQHVYSLAPRADVVYFLTDGELYDFTPDDWTRLRESGGGVMQRLRNAFGRGEAAADVVNTISLDDRSSEPDLQAMAAASGGGYVAAKSTA